MEASQPAGPASVGSAMKNRMGREDRAPVPARPVKLTAVPPEATRAAVVARLAAVGKVPGAARRLAPWRAVTGEPALRRSAGIPRGGDARYAREAPRRCKKARLPAPVAFGRGHQPAVPRKSILYWLA